MTNTKSTKLDDERSKREDISVEKLMEKVFFARNDARILDKPISIELLEEVLEYLVMRCSEHYGNVVREVQ